MKVLITDVSSARAVAVADELRAHGHEVEFCHERATASTPCVAMEREGRCPLDEGAVDVMLDVRSEAGSRVAEGELGIVCAYRTNVPLVIAREFDGDDRFPGWQATTCAVEDAAVTCEAVVGRAPAWLVPALARAEDVRP